MSSTSSKDSWQTAKELVRAGDTAGLASFLDSLPSTELVLTVSRLREEDRLRMLTLLTPQTAAEVIEELPEAQATHLLEDLTPKQAAVIAEEIPTAERVDILSGLENVEAVLAEMTPGEASQTRQFLAYPEHTAGGLMIDEYVALPDQSSVQSVLGQLRSHRETYSNYGVQYLYITDPEGGLTGVLRLRDLVLAGDEVSVNSIMIASPLSVRLDAPLDELIETFHDHSFLALPVVDGQNRLAGVVRRVDVETAGTELSNQSFLKLSGIVGGEELRSMPVRQRAVRRLSWLSVNILLNMVAASIIALYQETLSAAIALAVFLPIVSDMSGCSGNQAVAVSIRELTLGTVRARDLLHVLGREVTVGLINGCVLGLMLSGVTLLWKGNPYLGLVAGGALAMNTVLAVCLGGLLPLILQGLKLDPAIASGPILTTVTDMCGFFFVLSFATALLPRLV